MKKDNNILLMRMMEHDEGDPGRIHHFMKVYGFAKMIGEMESIPEEKQYILEIASIVHDIGIKPSLEKYGDSIGPHQEEMGEITARKLLSDMDYEASVIERVSYLVGHHHTYAEIDDIDYQILIEADFLVNLYENRPDNSTAKMVLETFFKTESGKEMMKKIFTPDKALVYRPKNKY